MKTSHFALAVLTASLLCVGNVVGQDEKTTKSDDANTLASYRKAAELGDAKAMYALGAVYAHGKGVIKDHAEAYAWLNEQPQMVIKRPPSYATHWERQ